MLRPGRPNPVGEFYFVLSVRPFLLSSCRCYTLIAQGFFINELFRRTDPKKRSLGQFIQDEIAGPLKIDLYLGMHGNTADYLSRCALLLRSCCNQTKFVVLACSGRIQQRKIANGGCL